MEGLERLALAAMPLLEDAGDDANLVHVWVAIGYGVANARGRMEDWANAAEHAIRHARAAGVWKITTCSAWAQALRLGPAARRRRTSNDGRAPADAAPAPCTPWSVPPSSGCSAASRRRGRSPCLRPSVSTRRGNTVRPSGSQTSPRSRPTTRPPRCTGRRPSKRRERAGTRRSRRPTARSSAAGSAPSAGTTRPSRSLTSREGSKCRKRTGSGGRYRPASSHTADDYDEAEALAREALARLDRTDILTAQGDGFLDLAEVLLAAGRTERGRRGARAGDRTLRAQEEPGHGRPGQGPAGRAARDDRHRVRAGESPERADRQAGGVLVQWPGEHRGRAARRQPRPPERRGSGARRAPRRRPRGGGSRGLRQDPGLPQGQGADAGAHLADRPRPALRRGGREPHRRLVPERRRRRRASARSSSPSTATTCRPRPTTTGASRRRSPSSRAPRGRGLDAARGAVRGARGARGGDRRASSRSCSASVAELAPVEGRPAQAGDTVVIDVVAPTGEAQRDVVVELGAGKLVEEIEAVARRHVRGRDEADLVRARRRDDTATSR